MAIFNFLKKRSRIDIIESTANALCANIVNSDSDFTEIEQAKIIQRMNNIFVQRFSDSYDDAYNKQQRILEAKELIK